MLTRLRRILSPTPADRRAEFWRWFAANADTLATVPAMPPDERAHTYGVMRRHLGPVDERLVPTIEPVGAEGMRLVIGAGGRSEAFAAADALAAEAPPLVGWAIVALAPPDPSARVARVGEVEVRLEGARFAQLDREGLPGERPEETVAVVIVLPGFPEHERPARVEAARTLLRDFLGERAAARLRLVDVVASGGAVPAEVTRPLAALPGVLEG